MKKNNDNKITCTLCDGHGFVSNCCAWTIRDSSDMKNKANHFICDQCGKYTKLVKCILCDGEGVINK